MGKNSQADKSGKCVKGLIAAPLPSRWSGIHPLGFSDKVRVESGTGSMSVLFNLEEHRLRDTEVALLVFGGVVKSGNSLSMIVFKVRSSAKAAASFWARRESWRDLRSLVERDFAGDFTKLLKTRCVAHVS
jgi:hypothetical protein